MCAQQSHEKCDDTFRASGGDYGLAAAKGLISVVPAIGGIASELFGLVLATPMSKRRDTLLMEINSGLQKLKIQVDGFSIENLADNEAFVSTTLEVVAIGVRTHQKAKLEAARNIVLNAALPNAPNDSLQKTFVNWLDEMTEWHLAILRLFANGRMPSLDLNNPEWRMYIELDAIGDRIEREYPELVGRYSFYVEIIGDLHVRGLLTNLIPEKRMTTRIEHSPVLSPLAHQFLHFIETPITEEKGSTR